MGERRRRVRQRPGPREEACWTRRLTTPGSGGAGPARKTVVERKHGRPRISRSRLSGCVYRVPPVVHYQWQPGMLLDRVAFTTGATSAQPRKPGRLKSPRLAHGQAGRPRHALHPAPQVWMPPHFVSPPAVGTTFPTRMTPRPQPRSPPSPSSSRSTAAGGRRAPGGRARLPHRVPQGIEGGSAAARNLRGCCQTSPCDWLPEGGAATQPAGTMDVGADRRISPAEPGGWLPRPEDRPSRRRTRSFGRAQAVV